MMVQAWHLLEQRSDLPQCVCAGSNPKGIYNQVKDAVKLKPDIGFDMIAAVCVSHPLHKLVLPFIKKRSWRSTCDCSHHLTWGCRVTDT